MTRVARAFASGFREAVRSLVRTKSRTLSGLPGVAIGIASVIAMASTGGIATEEARRRFEALGTDIVTIQADTSRSRPGIALADDS